MIFALDDDFTSVDLQSLAGILWSCECLAMLFRNEVYWAYYWAIIEHFARVEASLVVEKIANLIEADLEEARRAARRQRAAPLN